MKKKEIINNECQLCDHSAKEYLCLHGKLALMKARFCTNLDMSDKDRNRCLNNKAKCERFKVARTINEEQIGDVKFILKEISEQLSLIACKLNEMEKTDE